MRKSIIALAAAALGLTALPTLAADNGVYLGGSIGQSSLQIDDFSYDADATGYKLIVGWRFLDWLAVEGNYIDFGSGDDSVDDTRIDAATRITESGDDKDAPHGAAEEADSASSAPSAARAS